MTIVISGATGGVGTAIAEIFSSNGYDTVLLGRDMDKLGDLSESIKGRHGTHSNCYFCDANNLKSIEDCINSINTKYDKLEMLINVAGVFPYGLAMELSDELYDECMSVNLRLPFLLSTGMFGSLKKNKGGKIVNIGSSSAYAGFKNTAIYCASKHALLGLSRSLNDEWKESGVTVHCVSPGTVDTSMADVLEQDRSTYIVPDEFAQLIYDIASYNGNMLVEEVMATRRIIR
jgi:short-subunit dehydrogenase